MNVLQVPVELEPSRYLARFRTDDKKNKNGELNFALIEDIAKPLINISASTQDVKEAFALYNNLLA